MGVSITTMSKDKNGKYTSSLFTKNRLPHSKNKNRKLQLISQYVALQSEPTHGRIGSPVLVESRAYRDPVVMLTMIAGKALKKGLEERTITLSRAKIDHPKLPPLAMFSILKKLLKSEERVLRFDFLSLNERCVQLLRRVQEVCVEQSPLDYPADEWGGDRKINEVPSHMFAGTMGLKRSQPTRFKETGEMVRELIRTEGEIESKRARERTFVDGDGNLKVEDVFEVPEEDNITLSDRAKFGLVIFQRKDGEIMIL